jgi:two-component system response regulator YesN
MLKLLIVDDEPIIRGGIRGLIEWNQYGYTICGEAEDGASAVKAILELKPDLVLIDLHLPGFSGLEVIRKIRTDAAGGDIHFLIISGYAEFEYAQEAINLEVDGYITKPIDENILTEKIISIEQKIKRNEPQERRQIQFLEIMEGRYSEEINGPFCFNCGFVQAVFVSVGLPPAAGSLPIEEAADRMQTLRNFFQKDICHIFSYREFAVYLFENTPETAVKRLLDNLCACLDKFDDWYAVTLGSRCQEKDSLHGVGIRTSDREAEELMESVFFYRDKKYLSLDDFREKNSAAADWNGADEKELCACIQVIDHEKIRSFFKTLENNFFRSLKPPQEIRRECMELMIEVRGDKVNKFPALKEMPGTGTETFDAIMKLRYLGDIIDAMTEACLRVSESLPLLSADSSFQRIISYVKNNYNEDLRLETLGRLFNYNCAYLGKRFKEYTGKSFHSYLDMLRIDAAKELLRGTGMKVYEISQAVGYANTDYFYSKFKKYAGESPLVYKKMGG